MLYAYTKMEVYKMKVVCILLTKLHSIIGMSSGSLHMEKGDK